ncbi:conserved protein of unknown function [Streptantibioticus cattleyicolor NRRL 8057 = DSM 46488]|nr:conserved protein of unknown function [Streptantibioticus cattleyicolor NRRL 8057 = DSM 46488]
MQEITGGDAVHRITGLPGEPDAVGLAYGLGRLRALGVTGLRVALPTPGHPLGLSGPPEFNEVALAAGEAVLTEVARGPGAAAPLGLVPSVTEAGPAPDDLHVEVVWRCSPVRDAPPADVPSLGEAEQELAEAMREATAALARLDVAGAGPAARAALEAYRARAGRGREVLAPGYPPRAIRVLELAQRVAALTQIARGDEADAEHGAAVSASEIAARAAVLRPVERTARRAQVAAYNAYVEHSARR